MPGTNCMMLAAMLKAGAIAELVIKRGESSGWSDNPEDTVKILNWLNRHLETKPD